ncbi:MAG: efflux RND transporter permease subunit [Candidatus Riflebacteria bacterium]|nr:efflux RND transporter permease subunit [Candidatus Riflebacteria bacterium]
MIEQIIAFSMRNRFIVIILTLIMIVFGIHTVYLTPIDAIPDLSENQVIVFADWMGRSPNEIEDQVTYPMSVNLQGLAGVKSVRSSSEFNFSMINVIFEDNVDIYFARARVLERLSGAGSLLPAGVVPYMAPDASALGQIYWYTVEGNGVGLDRRRALQDWFIRYQLNSVPGVAQVATVGGAAREYQIDIDPNRLRAFGITLGEIVSAVSRSNSSVGGRVIQKGNAEYVVRSIGWIESTRDIENIVITERNQTPILVKHVAHVQIGPDFKRAYLEQDGSEAVGGVVLMRYGENPLEVIKRVKEKIRTLQSGLPEGVTIVPFYDRTPLIERAIHTLKGALVEEIIVAALAVFLIMGHLRSSFLVCLPLPLSVLTAFILMRWFGISSNIMSLSGIAISIGILVDQSIVMVENATHHLNKKFGSEPVTGDNTDFLETSCKSVGRPIFFSVLIMLVSFLPVFALEGMEGKMFHPLAFTKVCALIGVAIFSITIIPALIPLLLRGKLHHDEDSWLVRQLVEIYRPVLRLLMDRPKLVVWIFVATLSLGGLLMSRLGREFMPPLDEGSSLEMPITVPRVSVTQTGDDIRVRDAVIRQMPEVEQVVGKSGRADTPTDPSPLDMIETIINFRPKEYWPKRQLKQADAERLTAAGLDVLKERGIAAASLTVTISRDLAAEVAMNAVPEFDRFMRGVCLQRETESASLIGHELMRNAAAFCIDHARALGRMNREITQDELASRCAIVSEFETMLGRAFELHQTDHLFRSLAEVIIGMGVVPRGFELAEPEPSFMRSLSGVFSGLTGTTPETIPDRFWRELTEKRNHLLATHARAFDDELFFAAADGWGCLLARSLIAVLNERKLIEKSASASDISSRTTQEKAVAKVFADQFLSGVFLWRKTKADLIKEVDRMLSMPGWGNIWTQPIINRVDMLSTGVRTQIGVKVFGNDITKIQDISDQIAALLRAIPGAVDVFPDQSVGKGYLQIVINREHAARYGVSVGDIQDTIEAALGGRAITTTVEGRERFGVRIRYARDFREDEQSVRHLLVSGGSSGVPGASDGSGMGNGTGAGSRGGAGMSATAAGSAVPRQIPLEDVASITVVEGPAMIKSENGLLRNYVQLNVRDRDLVGFVEEAQRAVSAQIRLPPGMYIEWSGQFEHQLRAKRTLTFMFPMVLIIIFVILYMTYREVTDALLVMLAVPGALAGGVFFQYLFGFNFSVAVWVGYIACFGMATETGIIMLVYLREAIENKGGLANIRSLEELKDVVLIGAVHRLRPKILTEVTAIIGLAPMLWSTGTGAEIMRPMAAPVLGGLLIADEVIDLFLPVLFYWVRKQRWLAITTESEITRQAEPKRH